MATGRGAVVRALTLGIALAALPAPVAADPPPAPGSGEDAPGPHRWIFAAEDTARIPAFFEMSEIEIRADRLRIGDIVRMCIEREEELRDRIETHEYTMVSTAVLSFGGGDDPERQRVMQQTDRVFFRKSGGQRTVPIRRATWALERGERKEWSPDEDDDPSVDVQYGDLTDLPFYLEEKDDYDFEIRSREIVGDRVIYEVRLTPRSDFEIAPAGTIWIDTSTFSILREEFDFGDRVPLPLLIRRIGPYVRERERIGDLWVWKRILIRVELRGKLLRWIDRDVPDVAEWTVVFGDHRVNEGLAIDDLGAPGDSGGTGSAKDGAR